MNEEQHLSWRDVLAVHPAAEKLPMMSEVELRELADDIKENGLLEKITIIEQDDVPYLLDGRNRLDALQLLGREIFVSKYNSGALTFGAVRKRKRKRKEALAADKDRSSLSGEVFRRETLTEDPFAFVLSKNVHRRHLTPEQKRPLTIELVKASAELSNSYLAELADVDDHEIAGIRAELEATSEIPRLEKTIGKDGKARPARRTALSTPTPEPTPPMSAAPAPLASTPTSEPSAPDPTAESAEALHQLTSQYRMLLETWLPKMNAEHRAEAFEVVGAITEKAKREYLGEGTLPLLKQPAGTP